MQVFCDTLIVLLVMYMLQLSVPLYLKEEPFVSILCMYLSTDTVFTGYSIFILSVSISHSAILEY